MPFNALTSPDQFQIIGPVSMINDPNNSQNVAQAVATGTAVIAVKPGDVEVILTAAAATTGASLPAGSYHGQLLFITISTAAANTVTFAAVGTSNVAGGAGVSLAGLATHLLRWNALVATPAWYQVGPLAN
jgi:hypothetical protein